MTPINMSVVGAVATRQSQTPTSYMPQNEITDVKIWMTPSPKFMNASI